MTEAFAILERSVHAALEMYSNVHRGSGHKSMATTGLFEHARDVVLEHLGLSNGKYAVIFCTPRRAEALKARMKPGSYMDLSSQDIGLPLGVRALAVKKNAFPENLPFLTGGGTARLVSPGTITWAQPPARFEAGTPAIVSIITFAKALQLVKRFGKNAFIDLPAENLSPPGVMHSDGLEGYSGQKLLDELRQTLIGRSVRVPTARGAQPYVNLDNGASTPTFVPIWDVVRKTWRQPGNIQQEIISEARSICAVALGAPLALYDCIFTSNTTEAINLVAESLWKEAEDGVETVICNTLLEHNSNELPWRMVPAFSLVKPRVDAEGFIDINELETLLCAYNQNGRHGKKRIRLVTMSGASNVLGSFNDVSEIARISHKYGAQVLVDAAQLVAHRKVEMEKCGIDYLAFSGHKVYAPFGSGALLARKGLLNFGHSEMKSIQASGEENPGGIAALGKALALLQRIGFDLIQEEEHVLTKRALNGLARIPGLTIYGIKDIRSPRFARKGGVILFRMKSIMANRVAKELASQGGIGVRSGCHCAHLIIKRLLDIPAPLAKFQHVILFLFPQLSLPGLVRVSLGIGNDEKDVDALIQVIGKIALRRRSGVNRQSATAGNDTPAALQFDFKRQLDDFVREAVRRVYA